MVEFEYQPFKKVIIHEITKIPLDLYIITRSLAADDGGIAQPLVWIDGIVFEHAILPPTDDIVNESIKGTIHWSLLSYADMEEYKEELEGPRKVKIPVIKQESSLFRDMARWIKEVYESSVHA